MIALQLLEYMVACWRLKGRQEQPLPMIIPLVVYHGKREWKVGLRLADLFTITDRELLKYLPDFSYLLYDLGDYPDEQIAGIPALKLALLLLKYIYYPQLLQKLVQLLVLLSDHPNWAEKLEATIVYILYATDIEPDELISVTSEAISSQGGAFAMSTAQKLIEQGMQKGLQEGLQKGLQKACKKACKKDAKKAYKKDAKKAYKKDAKKAYKKACKKGYFMPWRLNSVQFSRSGVRPLAPSPPMPNWMRLAS